MTALPTLSQAVADFRAHFDQSYLGVIPRLFTEDGRLLAFTATLTAIEALAGVYAPVDGTGERFRAFISNYFPGPYREHVASLWAARNRAVHALNPVPFLLTSGNSRMHLQSASGTFMLNVEDLYADLVGASRAYFTDLYSSPALQQNFAKRINSPDGGMPTLRVVQEHRA